MSPKINKVGTPSPSSRRGMSIVPESGGDNDCSSLPSMGGVTESLYSGYEPNLLPMSHEVYSLIPPTGTVDERRRHHRISVRNVWACIKTEQGRSVVANLINISRGGVCFTSTTEFCPGTPVSVATHYIEGGQNIYQDGRIIRVPLSGLTTIPGVYAIEFLLNINNPVSKVQ